MGTFAKQLQLKIKVSLIAKKWEIKIEKQFLV